jgi:hypothetical protein
MSLNDLNEKTGKGYGLLFEGEQLVTKNKEYKSTVWLTDQFPRKVNDLLPVLEILAPTMKHFGQLKDFLDMKFPDFGFSVKIGIRFFILCFSFLIYYSLFIINLFTYFFPICL